MNCTHLKLNFKDWLLLLDNLRLLDLEEGLLLLDLNLRLLELSNLLQLGTL